jgi:hypothetical protein
VVSEGSLHDFALETFRDYLGVLVRVPMDSYHRQSTQWQGGIARQGLKRS